jgi:predicted phosphoadenosine phosphosulfate sulfurtransferase
MTQPKGNVISCSPIYDWRTLDIWLGFKTFGWDYAKTYDLMDMAGMTPHQQRVCAPFGEEPLHALHIYAECWPDLWHKMIKRVPGAATAARYARTELYGRKLEEPPDGMTWKEYLHVLLDGYPEKERKTLKSQIAEVLRNHSSKTKRPVPNSDSDILSGVSWKWLCMMVSVGDSKGRQKGMLTIRASAELGKTKMSLEEARAMETKLTSRY